MSYLLIKKYSLTFLLIALLGLPIFGQQRQKIAYFFNSNGYFVGKVQGVEGIYIITDFSTMLQWHKTFAEGGRLSRAAIDSLVHIPKVRALSVCIELLEKTNQSTPKDSIGGLHEESALMLHDDTVLHGASGDLAFEREGQLITTTRFPTLPEYKTWDDVALTIHSHVTGQIQQKYYQSALKPSAKDSLSFQKSPHNIIAGRLGIPDARFNPDGTIRYFEKPMGIVGFDEHTNHLYTLNIRVIRQIIKRIAEEEEKRMI